MEIAAVKISYSIKDGVIMTIKMFILLLLTATSGLVSAAPFTDTNFTDNGDYTTDETTGLDWLDLTETSGRSYNDISAKLGSGGEFEGWSYASAAQVAGFFQGFGIVASPYNGWNEEFNGLFDKVSPLWGDLYAEFGGLTLGNSRSCSLSIATTTPVLHT